MPPTPNAPYVYTPETITAKKTSDTAIAAELVGQVTSVEESAGTRDTDEISFIGLADAVSFPKGKGAKEVTLTLRAISTEFEGMCRDSYDDFAVRLTVVLTSKGVNHQSSAVDVVTKTTTYIGYVSSELTATTRNAGETEEYQVTLQLTSAPAVTITGGVA